MATNGFGAFRLKEGIEPGIAAMKWEEPLPLQSFALPKLLHNDDVILVAKPGSGKTAVVLISILDVVDISSDTVQAIILVPDETDAKLVLSVLAVLSHTMKFGSSDVILVGTPAYIFGRRELAKLDACKLLILDKADDILSNDADTAVKIIEILPKNLRFLLNAGVASSKIETFVASNKLQPNWIFSADALGGTIVDFMKGIQLDATCQDEFLVLSNHLLTMLRQISLERADLQTRVSDVLVKNEELQKKVAIMKQDAIHNMSQLGRVSQELQTAADDIQKSSEEFIQYKAAQQIKEDTANAERTQLQHQISAQQEKMESLETKFQELDQAKLDPPIENFLEVFANLGTIAKRWEARKLQATQSVQTDPAPDSSVKLSEESKSSVVKEKPFKIPKRHNSEEEPMIPPKRFRNADEFANFDPDTDYNDLAESLIYDAGDHKYECLVEGCISKKPPGGPSIFGKRQDAQRHIKGIHFPRRPCEYPGCNVTFSMSDRSNAKALHAEEHMSAEKEMQLKVKPLGEHSKDARKGPRSSGKK